MTAAEVIARALCLYDCALVPDDPVQVKQTAAYVDANWRSYLRRARGSLAALRAAGFAVVQREASEVMLLAGYAAQDAADGSLAACHRAMVAASEGTTP